MRPKSMFLAACLALLCLGGLAEAQKIKNRGGEGKREKIREKVRQMRMAKLIEVLDMDEATATKLLPRMNDYYDKIGEVQHDTGEARRELRALLDADKVDAAKVNKLIDRMIANRDKVHTLESDMIKEVRKILTAEQAAKMIVVLPKINRGLEQKIRKAAGGGGGRGGDEPPDDE